MNGQHRHRWGRAPQAGSRPGHLHPGEEGHLSDLKIGQKAVVLALHNDHAALRRRLLDMGLTAGVIVQIKKIAPLGDPVDIVLRGYELCVRRSEMANIDIRVVA